MRRTKIGNTIEYWDKNSNLIISQLNTELATWFNIRLYNVYRNITVELFTSHMEIIIYKLTYGPDNLIIDSFRDNIVYYPTE